MADEEKIIHVNTFEDFDREPGRDGDEESREGTMRLDGKATDAPFTVKAAARLLGDGHELNLSVPLPQGLPEPAMSRAQMATGLQACTPRAGGNACPTSIPPRPALASCFFVHPPLKKVSKILENSQKNSCIPGYSRFTILYCFEPQFICPAV